MSDDLVEKLPCDVHLRSARAALSPLTAKENKP